MEQNTQTAEGELTTETWVATNAIRWIVVDAAAAAADPRMYPRFGMGEAHCAVLHQMWTCKETGAGKWRIVELSIDEGLAEKERLAKEAAGEPGEQLSEG